jgi:hypothetical protein
MNPPGSCCSRLAHMQSYHGLYYGISYTYLDNFNEVAIIFALATASHRWVTVQPSRKYYLLSTTL